MTEHTFFKKKNILIVTIKYILNITYNAYHFIFLYIYNFFFLITDPISGKE